MAKVVVTGGAGFIGSHLVDALVARGDEVDIIDTFEGGMRGERMNSDNTCYHAADIRDPDVVRKVMAGAEIVFHLAAIASVPFSIDEPSVAFDVNLRGMHTVLDAARQAGVRRFVFASSAAVYGPTDATPTSENTTPLPMSPYAAHKLNGEVLCQAFARTYGIETVCLRYFNIYGPRMDPRGAYAAVVGVFLERWRKGLPLVVTGDGTQTRDFVHVRDVVRANLMAAGSGRVGCSDVINIGSGQSVSVNELAAMFGGTVEHVAPRDEPKHSRADIGRANRLLGWHPEVKLEDGIAELKRLS